MQVKAWVKPLCLGLGFAKGNWHTPSFTDKIATHRMERIHDKDGFATKILLLREEVATKSQVGKKATIWKCISGHRERGQWRVNRTAALSFIFNKTVWPPHAGNTLPPFFVLQWFVFYILIFGFCSPIICIWDFHIWFQKNWQHWQVHCYFHDIWYMVYLHISCFNTIFSCTYIS